MEPSSSDKPPAGFQPTTATIQESNAPMAAKPFMRLSELTQDWEPPMLKGRLRFTNAISGTEFAQAGLQDTGCPRKLFIEDVLQRHWVKKDE